MQHLALVLYKEYPQTCILLCIKIIVHVSFDCSIECIDLFALDVLNIF